MTDESIEAEEEHKSRTGTEKGGGSGPCLAVGVDKP